MSNDLLTQRDKLLALHDRGLVTEVELHRSLLQLMVESPSDSTAIKACESLPSDFRESFRGWLCDLAEQGYGFRWFSMGDRRTPDQVETDTRQCQAFLQRMVPQLLVLLTNDGATVIYRHSASIAVLGSRMLPNLVAGEGLSTMSHD